MNRQEWAKAFLQVCGYGPGTLDVESGIPQNVLAIVCWINSEGSTAQNNPLDTTENWANATDFNPQGVKNYQSTSDGLQATRATLFNGDYTLIDNCLQVGNDANNTIAAINHSPWGSKPTIQMLNNIRKNYPIFANVHVTGTGDTTVVNDVPSADGKPIAAPIVSSVTTLTGDGYYLVGADGGVFCFGNAKYYGSIPALQQANTMGKLNAPIVSMNLWPDGDGYVLVAADGGVFAFGSAKNLGTA